MKVYIVTVLAIGMLFASLSSALADGNEEANMAKWSGVHRVEGFAGVKAVFTPKGTSTSVGVHVTVYPWKWATEDGVNLAGIGYKGNYWDSPSGYGRRHLGELALRGYRPWGSYRFSLLGGIQDEKYGSSEPRHTLYGVGGYASLNHNGLFPKTEIWAQVLKANGSRGGKTDAIIDVGGRQYLVKDATIKPYIEANLSVGVPDRYASLGVVAGITDRREIFYLAAGAQCDLQHGGCFPGANAGISTSNAVDAAIRSSEASKVTAVPPAPVVKQETEEAFGKVNCP